MQTTLTHALSFQGVGLHSGESARLTLQPAPVGHGVVFERTDVTATDRVIQARYHVVQTSPLCTWIENSSGVAVSTIEHVMAALAGCGVHNVLVQVDGPECPILDGSSVLFVRGILETGVLKQDAPIRAIEVLKTVEVKTDKAWARMEPGQGLTMDFHIDFSDAAIGKQTKRLNLANGTFVKELSNCRTFCRAADVADMHAAGKALGGSVYNAVVIDGARVLTPGGLRHKDEAVRHKMLDALGDLALAGAPILGHYHGHKAGHAVTNALVHAIMNDPTSHRMIECTPEQAASLPGAGVGLHEMPEVA